MAEKFWHVKSCPLFERLDESQLSWLESQCRGRELPAKTPIYLPADCDDRVFVLASGRAKICHATPEGKQSILSFIEPGELFGELALVTPGQRDEYAETVEKCLVVMIPSQPLQELMATTPELTLGVTRLIGLRRRRIETRLKNLLFMSNRERLTHLLLELAEQYGSEGADGIELSIKLSHQDLASIIGSTRETVTVVLGELQSEGLVRVGRRRIVLLDSAALARSVERPEPELPSPAPTPAAYPS